MNAQKCWGGQPPKYGNSRVSMEMGILRGKLSCSFNTKVHSHDGERKWAFLMCPFPFFFDEEEEKEFAVRYTVQPGSTISKSSFILDLTRLCLQNRRVNILSATFSKHMQIYCCLSIALKCFPSSLSLLSKSDTIHLIISLLWYPA